MSDITKEEFKERMYTALGLDEEERELADAMIAVGEVENEIFRLRREAFMEHAHAVAEQVSAEFSDAIAVKLGDGHMVGFDETPL